jgi:hypothetical protein
MDRASRTDVGVRIVAIALLSLIALIAVFALWALGGVVSLGRGWGAGGGSVESAIRAAPANSVVLYEGVPVAVVDQIGGARRVGQPDSLMVYFAHEVPGGMSLAARDSMVALVDPVVDWGLPVALRVVPRSSAVRAKRNGTLVVKAWSHPLDVFETEVRR